MGIEKNLIRFFNRFRFIIPLNNGFRIPLDKVCDFDLKLPSIIIKSTQNNQNKTPQRTFSPIDDDSFILSFFSNTFW